MLAGTGRERVQPVARALRKGAADRDHDRGDMRLAIRDQEQFEPRTSEGFSAGRLKYKSGVVAIVQDQRQPAFTYPTQQSEMGPFLPENMRR